MRQLPPSRSSAGYSPNRLQPLAVAPVLDQGQRLTDIQAIQRLFAKGENGGYWPADGAFLYEDSAGTTAASLNGVVGLWVNNVSGKPNAIQATTANKPYLRRTPISNKYWLDSNTSTGALTATFASSLGSACTIATVGAEGVTILEGQTIGTTYNIAPAFGYNGDVLIINRALTAAEKALVTRVLARGVPILTLKSAAAFNSLSDWNDTTDCSVSNGALVITPNPNVTWRYPYSKVVFNIIANSQYILKWTEISGISTNFGVSLNGVLNIPGKSTSGTYLQTYISTINRTTYGQFRSPFQAAFNKLELHEVL